MISMNKAVNSILLLIMIICIYFSIRWCDLPVVNNNLCRYFFVTKKPVDSILSSLTTGYITGYFIYMLTVLIPDYFKKKPFKRDFIDRLAKIYMDCIYLFLLICKESCLNEDEWNNLIKDKDDDIECIIEKCKDEKSKNNIEIPRKEFINIMQNFDIMSSAPTIYLKRIDEKNRRSLNWAEYLLIKYGKIHDLLEEMYNTYHFFLDYDDIKVLKQFTDSQYFNALLGLENNANALFPTFATESESNLHDAVPLLKIYESYGYEYKPIFFSDNIAVITNHIEVLKCVNKYLNKSKSKIFKRNYAINILKSSQEGKIGNSRFDYKNALDRLHNSKKQKVNG